MQLQRIKKLEKMLKKPYMSPKRKKMQCTNYRRKCSVPTGPAPRRQNKPEESRSSQAGSPTNSTTPKLSVPTLVKETSDYDPDPSISKMTAIQNEMIICHEQTIEEYGLDQTLTE